MIKKKLNKISCTLPNKTCLDFKHVQAYLLYKALILGASFIQHWNLLGEKLVVFKIYFRGFKLTMSNQ